MEYSYYEEVYYYMDDDGHVQAAFLTPYSMLGDMLLFDTEEECRKYWQAEWSGSDEMEAAA